MKTSVAVTAKESVMVGMRSMPGSPYDGHTQHSQLEQVEILTGVKPTLALADRGYRGAAPPEGTQLLISHTRGLPPALKKLLKRRRAIEPPIGHMKTDGLLARNGLKGSDSDAIHAVLGGAGQKLRLILAHLRVLLLASIALIVLGQIGGAASADAQNDSVERQAGCSGPTAQGYRLAEAVKARAHARERP